MTNERKVTHGSPTFQPPFTSISFFLAKAASALGGTHRLGRYLSHRKDDTHAFAATPPSDSLPSSSSSSASTSSSSSPSSALVADVTASCSLSSSDGWTSFALPFPFDLGLRDLGDAAFLALERGFWDWEGSLAAGLIWYLTRSSRIQKRTRFGRDAGLFLVVGLDDPAFLQSWAFC